MKKTYVLFAVLCLAAVTIAQTARIPMNIFEGTVIRYTPGSKTYHLPNCPEIAGAQVYQADIFTAKLWGMEPCKTCLYKDQAVTPAAEMPKVAGTNSIASWEGTANKNTETFEVKSPEWKIEWATRGDSNFSITVYNADSNKYVELIANIIGNGQESTIMRGAGRYYLKISTSQSYRIQVYDNR